MAQTKQWVTNLLLGRDEDAPAAAILSYRAWQWRHAVFTTVATGISKDHFHDAVLKAEGPFASPWAAGHRTGPSSRADFFDHLVKAVVNKDGCQAGNRSRHEAHHARYLEALAAAAPRSTLGSTTTRWPRPTWLAET